jgi:hypothetical protein
MLQAAESHIHQEREQLEAAADFRVKFLQTKREQKPAALRHHSKTATSFAGSINTIDRHVRIQSF